MSLTQFAMVEELASLVRENIPCKHLILSMEEMLVNLLQDGSSFNGVLELEPMNPYKRLLIHRLAEIFGFSHKSIGEGEDRHLVLELCPETSIPSILVSDLLWQSDEVQSPMILDVFKREGIIQGQRDFAVVESSHEERKTAYLGARERSFSEDACDVKLAKNRPQHDLVVARRMITHALGQTNKAANRELSLNTKEYEHESVKNKPDKMGLPNSSTQLETKLMSAKHPTSKTAAKVEKTSGDELDATSRVSQQKNGLLQTKRGSAVERNENKIEGNNLKNEHMGAAKRLLTIALGIHRKDVNQSCCSEPRNPTG